MEKVCGSGAQCENTCPVMSMGRICPDLPTFLEEVAEKFGINRNGEAAQLEPVLA
jgi:hypothetical protein